MLIHTKWATYHSFWCTRNMFTSSTNLFCSVRLNQFISEDQNNHTKTLWLWCPSSHKQILQWFICDGNNILPSSDPTAKLGLKVWAKQLPQPRVLRWDVDEQIQRLLSIYNYMRMNQGVIWTSKVFPSWYLGPFSGPSSSVYALVPSMRHLTNDRNKC